MDWSQGKFPGEVTRKLVDSDQIARRIEEMGREIAADYGDRSFKVVILLTGALWFAADLTRALGRSVPVETLRASSYLGGRESLGWVELEGHIDVAGWDVLVVDDVLDTGRTLSRVREELVARGAREVRTAVMFEKQVTRAVEYAAEYSGFVVGKEFLVGYGLDDKGEYRNLPWVGVIE